MKCPVCKDPSLVISERKGIEIDYCPDCRGIWLDRGELDKILEKSKEADQVAMPTQASSNFPAQPHYPNYKYKKKKSFLEELFD